MRMRVPAIKVPLFLAAVWLLVVTGVPAHGYPRPSVTERVAEESDQKPPSVSADGRFVAFGSTLKGPPGGTFSTHHVFVHDRLSGATEVVSLASDGTPGNDLSWDPSVSADGRFVAFMSNATNLVPGDTNAKSDIFVHDRQTDTTELVSVASNGAQGNGSSFESSISADGRLVAFDSQASNLVAGDTNAQIDVFVHDRTTGSTERVSVSSDGAQGNGSEPSISTDGRFVAFGSAATNLVAEDTNAKSDVFVRDRTNDTTERVSVATGGAEGDAGSVAPSISADGRYVAFASGASNFVPSDTNGINPLADTPAQLLVPPDHDVFVHDRQSGTTERVSVASDGAQADESSSAPDISADGRFVAFQSTATNLVPEDANAEEDGFVHDRFIGSTERVSVASDGTEANGSSASPALSAEGSVVVFRSAASNLVPGDNNPYPDMFVHQRGLPLGVLGSLSLLKVPGGVGVFGRATISGATVVQATDPGGDGATVGPVPARDLGAELTGAEVVYRHELEDLLVRVDLASLPPTTAGLPGILYGLDLTAGTTRFQVRALRAAASSVPAQSPYFSLYRCQTSCVLEAPLSGSFGTKGEEVLISIPLARMGAGEGTSLTGLRAFTALGEAALGSAVPLDEAALPGAVVPATRVELGIAPASTPAANVVYTASADVFKGEFSGTVSTASRPPGSYRVWARTCLGAICGGAVSGAISL